jgi:hypothetical protein
MKHSASVALVVLVLVGGTAAGCGTKDPVAASTPSSPAGAPSSTPPAPKDVLLASVKTFDTTPCTFQIKQADKSGQGKTNPATKSASVTLSGKVSGQSISLGYLVIGTDVWMKFDLGAAGNKQLGINKTKWLRIDPTKVKDKTAIPVDANGAFSMGTPDFLDGVVSAQRTDSTHFSGIVDMTNANSMLAPDKSVLAKIGDKGKAVPFTATLDSQGRLIDFKADGTAIDPGVTIEVSFANFGVPQAITRPTGAVPAPAAVYAIFAG